MAQDYPTRTITLVVPFAAGGGVDVMGRLLAEKLRASLGQQVIVDNKPGASGMLGALAVVRAPADGHTLLLGSAGETAINPFIFKARMQYSPDKDLVPITPIVKVPNVLVARPDAPFKSVDELVVFAKKNPGKLTYATSGVGNPQHLNGELLEEMAGIHMVHVPYRGASAQLLDVAGGNVDMTFVSMAAAAPFLKDGRVKPIAVTSAKRAAFAPDVPAIAESKVASKYALENWFGLFAPAATPAPVLAKINAAVVQALQDPELAKRMTDQGGLIAPMSPTQFRDFIKAESAQYARIVDFAKITAD
ncbi:Bug family tripartite tricarboxylate transporter substrate binding protein [Piscinibacter sakaiensis]|uniref:Bug family tripartite tricarboxylate transporter substrate binding protein n=1 Tax=Piscinibacter sakaiensis TaxID=1547922 RepID=UPI003AAAAF94